MNFSKQTFSLKLIICVGWLAHNISPWCIFFFFVVLSTKYLYMNAAPTFWYPTNIIICKSINHMKKMRVTWEIHDFDESTNNSTMNQMKRLWKIWQTSWKTKKRLLLYLPWKAKIDGITRENEQKIIDYDTHKYTKRER